VIKLKKIIVSIIIIGLLLTTFMATENAKTCRPYIYVDDDNTQGPWDGTQEHPYQYVQDGIDNAQEGDTIYVFSGFYDKYLTLSKSVNFIGEDRDSTILNWSICIEDYIDGITIHGFTLGMGGIALFHSSFHEIYDNNFLNLRSVCLVNCSNCIVTNNIIKSMRGIVIDGRSCNNTISENYISGGELHGIRLNYYSKDNIITKNTIENNSDFGIDVSHSDNNIISNNIITNNYRGIDMFNSNNNIVSNNIITNNSAEGINPIFSDNCSISNNIITNNNGCGIALHYSDNSILSNNIIANNSDEGSWPCEGIYSVFSDNCSISNNIITNNSGNGIYVSSKNNTVNDNTITDNGENGIKLIGDADYNTFSGNTIADNNRFGISFTGPTDEEDIYHSNFNTFSGNTIRDNARFGVYINELCLGNLFYYNNFINNDQNAWDEGIFNRWHNSIKKEGNYWDDYTGIDRNGDGIGDTPYKIPGKIIQSKDRFPFMDPVDIEEIEVNTMPESSPSSN